MSAIVEILKQVTADVWKNLASIWRVALVALIAAFAIAVGAVFLRRVPALYEFNDVVILLVGISALLIALARVFTFLVGERKETTPTSVSDTNPDQLGPLLKATLEQLKTIRTEPTSSAGLSEERQESLSAFIQDKVSDALASGLTEEFTQKYKPSVINEGIQGLISMRSRRIATRLSLERLNQTRRAIFNLMLGVGIGGSGLYLLWHFIETVPYTGESFRDASAMASRIALVVLVQLLAYFFLSLYRKGLDEIKYFQNEITNIECRLLASQVGILAKSSGALEAALKSLAVTERNFVLRKDERTVGGAADVRDERDKLFSLLTEQLESKRPSRTKPKAKPKIGN